MTIHLFDTTEHMLPIEKKRKRNRDAQAASREAAC